MERSPHLYPIIKAMVARCESFDLKRMLKECLTLAHGYVCQLSKKNYSSILLRSVSETISPTFLLTAQVSTLLVFIIRLMKEEHYIFDRFSSDQGLE